MQSLTELSATDWETIAPKKFANEKFNTLIKAAIEEIYANNEIVNTTYFNAFYNRNMLHILLICNKDGSYDAIIKELAQPNRSPDLFRHIDSTFKNPYELFHYYYRCKYIDITNFKRTAMILLEIDAIRGDEKSSEIQQSLMHILAETNKDHSNAKEMEILAKKTPNTLKAKNRDDLTPFEFIHAKYKSRSNGNDFNTFKETSIILMKSGADVTLKKEIRNSTIYITSLLHIFCQNIQNITEEDIKIVVKTKEELLNLKDEFGRTPIHILFEQPSYYKFATNLLITAPNIHFVNRYGLSLLHAACQSGNFQAVKTLLELLEFNIDINSICNNKRTILHYAAISRNIELFNYLVKYFVQYANILNDEDYQGNTPLHLLLQENNNINIKDIRSLNIENFLDKKNSFGETLLHMTCKSGNLEMLKHLHVNGANLEEPTLSKKTALHLAAEYGHRGIVQWVIQTKKVQIDLKDAKQKTAIDYAKDKLPTQEIITANLTTNNGQNEYGLIVEQLTIGLLYDKIEKMVDYGYSLKEHSKEKSDVACELAESLKTIFGEYLKTDRSKSATDKFKNDFIKKLHSKDKEMQAYRFNWDTIKYNILIALTGIGLLFIAANLIYTRINQGRALFFYQKRTTTREEIIKDIEIATSSQDLNYLIMSG